MRPFQELRVWCKAHELALCVYGCTRQYPREERYGLTSQTRRAATSVPANLAEGCGKGTWPELRHGVDVAGGSLNELEYWFILGRDLGFLSSVDYDDLRGQLIEVRRLLMGFRSWIVRQ